MTFANPAALLLLLLLPILIVVGWPRLAYRRRRDAASLGLRLLNVTLIVLALAGPQMHRTADKLAVVFLLDGSDSVPPAQQSAAVDYVRQAAEAMGPQDQAGVIVFGADALVETPMTDRLELAQIGSDPVRLNTDLAEAMRLGLALFPADTAKRMVVLSDGRQTVGDAAEVARLAEASDVQIDYVALIPPEGEQASAGPEILIADLDAPATVNEGERFNLTATLLSNRAGGSAEIRVLSAGEMVQRREVELAEGTTREVFEVVAPGSGFIDFQVVIEPRSADTYYQNNSLSAFTRVTGPPRVLLVTTDEREVESLRAVLTESGLQVDVSGPRDLPIGLAPLSSYDSVVLVNVPATELSRERMETLQAYVRDLGGGLVAIGGPQSYGVGGYFETPLEETLPVEMRLRDAQRLPQLTLLFVIDRSGSMEISSIGGVSNLELAKEAVVRSFDLLNDNDRTGVLSFDISAYYVVEIQPVSDEANRERLRALIGSLRPGGGTNIRQGVLSADQVLRDDPSDLKHIILLTDGGSDPAGIAPAVDRMYQNYGITTSVVAVGADYARWLNDVAAAGRGKFHLAYDVSTIPAIFTAETLLATRSYISEQEFTPALAARHPIVNGLDSMPPLQGYVATTGKETAEVILRGPEDDPILAAWQYGLGRAVAFTSDASSRWAADWLNWDGYADFWNQALRWSITEGTTSNVEARIEQRGEQALLTVEVRDNRGGYLNGLRLDASVVNTQLENLPLGLEQTAPGRYEATFTPEDQGAYFVTVAGGTPGSADVLVPQRVSETTGWVLSYSAEYRLDAPGGANAPLALLQRLASITGGNDLGAAPQAAFAHNLDQERAAQPLWQYLLLAAVLLLPLDVAMRRLVLTRGDVARVREVLSAPLRSDVAEVYRPETAARLGRLLGAKDRARESAPPLDVAPFDELPTGAASSAETTKTAPPRPVAPAAPLAKKPQRPARSPAPPSTPAAPPADEGTLASRLLERRRGSADKDDRSS